MMLSLLKISAKTKMWMFRFKAFLSRTDLDYKKYWEERYRGGGTSGRGSYGEAAVFKANFINDFLDKNNIVSVIEFGCGDGHQLKHIHYKKYLGLDISKTSVERCRTLLRDDLTKEFKEYTPSGLKNDFSGIDLVVCLDVLYHIVDDVEFVKTLDDIFLCQAKYVILYTTLKEQPYSMGSHGKHRNTLNFLKKYTSYKIEQILDKDPGLSSTTSFVVLKKRE